MVVSGIHFVSSKSDRVKLSAALDLKHVLPAVACGGPIVMPRPTRQMLRQRMRMSGLDMARNSGCRLIVQPHDGIVSRFKALDLLFSRRKGKRVVAARTRPRLEAKQCARESVKSERCLRTYTHCSVSDSHPIRGHYTRSLPATLCVISFRSAVESRAQAQAFKIGRERGVREIRVQSRKSTRSLPTTTLTQQPHQTNQSTPPSFTNDIVAAFERYTPFIAG